MLSRGKHSFFPIAMLPPVTKSQSSFITSEAKIHGQQSKTVKKNILSLSEMLEQTFLKKNFDTSSPALFHDRKIKLTFRGLNDISTRMAQNLAKIMKASAGQTLKPNDEGDTVIAFMMKDDEIDEKAISLIIAAQKLGVTYMALDSTSDPGELLSTVETVKPVVLITGDLSGDSGIQDTVAKLANSSEIVTIRMTDLWSSSKVDSVSADKSIPFLDISDPEYWSDLPLNERTVAIFFTSGTVGSPHGVRIGVSQVFNRIRWQSKVFPLVEEDVCSLTSALTDPRSLAQIFAPLLEGKPLTILNKKDIRDPIRLVEQISAGKISRLTLTPPEFEMIVESLSKSAKYKFAMSSVTHWIISGGLFIASVARKFFKHFSGAYKAGVFLISTYGTTEVLGEATYEVFFHGQDLEEKITNTGYISVGVPICNTTVSILGDQDKGLPMGQRGEIALSGACLNVGGYVGQGGRTRANKVFPTKTDKSNLLFRTGDIGRIVLDKKGVRRLYIEGRMENTLKVGGIWVNLWHLSEYIKLTGLVQAAQVLTYHRGRESQVIIAACVLHQNVTLLQLKTKLREVITKPNTIVPDVFPVEQIPYDWNGKIDRRQLRESYRKYLLNCDEAEWKSVRVTSEKLSAVKIFCKAVALSLGVPLSQVISHYNSNYWDMGGSALNAVMTVKICSDNGLCIAVEDFVSAATLREIVERMDRYRDTNEPDAWLLDTDFSGKFSYDLMTSNDEIDVVRLLKDDCIPMGVSYSMHVINYWKALIENVRDNNLCVVAKNSDNKVVGVVVCGDADARMKFPKTPKEIAYGLEILEMCQEASRSEMWRKSTGRMAQIFYVALKDSQLSQGDAITLTQQLLMRTCLAAQSSRFSSIVISTANPLVQETCLNLLKFESLLEFPVARFQAKDKIRPFTYADEHHTSGVFIKDISWEVRPDGSGTVSKIPSVRSLSSPTSTVVLRHKFFA